MNDRCVACGGEATLGLLATVAAGLDEGILSFSLPILFYIENPYLQYMQHKYSSDE
jgi:hypothetical protein